MNEYYFGYCIYDIASFIMLDNVINCKKDGEIVNNVKPRTIRKEIYTILCRIFFYLKKFLPSRRGIKKGRWEQLKPVFNIYIEKKKERERQSF